MDRREPLREGLAHLQIGIGERETRCPPCSEYTTEMTRIRALRPPSQRMDTARSRGLLTPPGGIRASCQQAGPTVSWWCIRHIDPPA